MSKVKVCSPKHLPYHLTLEYRRSRNTVLTFVDFTIQLGRQEMYARAHVWCSGTNGMLKYGGKTKGRSHEHEVRCSKEGFLGSTFWAVAKIWKTLLRPAKQGLSQSEWLLTRGSCTGRVQDGCWGPEYRAQSVARNAVARIWRGGILMISQNK